MTRLEERLRDDLRAESETITQGSIVDLQLPRQARRGVLRRRTRPRPQTSLTWARPLAAAAAVVAVAAGTLVAVHSISHALPAGTSGSYSGFPANYASIETSTDGNGDGHATIMILRTATGSLLTKVSTPSPYNDVIQVSSDAAGNTFVFAVVRVTGQGSKPKIDGNPPMKFLMLRVTPGGRTHVSALPLSLPVSSYTGRNDWTPTRMAVSPDGSRLAVSYGGFGATAVVRVMTLATGSTRTWTLPNVTWAPVIAPQGSWTANSRTLAFSMDPNQSDSSLPVSVRLLDTAAPGTSLASARQVVLRGTSSEQACQVFITPNGAELIAAMSMPARARFPWEIPVRVLSARTGALLRTFGPPAGHGVIGVSPPLFWSNPSGSKLVMSESRNGSSVLGVLTGNRFEAGGAPLPRGGAFQRLSNALSGQSELQL